MVDRPVRAPLRTLRRTLAPRHTLRRTANTMEATVDKLAWYTLINAGVLLAVLLLVTWLG